jgi:hypothetical protein
VPSWEIDHSFVAGEAVSTEMPRVVVQAAGTMDNGIVARRGPPW